MNRKIFISTGEVSGDLHGSLLANALFNEAEKRSLDLEICGLGGERMRKEGVKILQDTTSISAIGIWEALPLIVPTIQIQKIYDSLKQFNESEINGFKKVIYSIIDENNKNKFDKINKE